MRDWRLEMRDWRLKRAVISIIITIALIVSLSGCATIKRKFIRKQKEKEKETPIYYTEDIREEVSNAQNYKYHYVLWKSSQAEAIDKLDEFQRGNGNKKAIRFFTQQALVNLGQMNNLLPEEKQNELKNFILRLENIAGRLEKKTWSGQDISFMKKELQNHKRAVEQNFSYKKVEGFIK